MRYAVFIFNSNIQKITAAVSGLLGASIPRWSAHKAGQLKKPSPCGEG